MISAALLVVLITILGQNTSFASGFVSVPYHVPPRGGKIASMDRQSSKHNKAATPVIKINGEASSVPIVPTRNNVVVSVKKQSAKSQNGVVIATQEKQATSEGTVIEIGSGIVDDNGKNHGLPLKKGDKVIFENDGVPIKYNEEDHQIIRLAQLLYLYCSSLLELANMQRRRCASEVQRWFDNCSICSVPLRSSFYSFRRQEQREDDVWRCSHRSECRSRQPRSCWW